MLKIADILNPKKSTSVSTQSKNMQTWLKTIYVHTCQLYTCGLENTDMKSLQALRAKKRSHDQKSGTEFTS